MLVFRKLLTFFKACCSITLDTESFTLNAIMLNVILPSRGAAHPASKKLSTKKCFNLDKKMRLKFVSF